MNPKFYFPQTNAEKQEITEWTERKINEIYNILSFYFCKDMVVDILKTYIKPQVNLNRNFYGLSIYGNGYESHTTTGCYSSAYIEDLDQEYLIHTDMNKGNVEKIEYLSGKIHGLHSLTNTSNIRIYGTVDDFYTLYDNNIKIQTFGTSDEYNKFKEAYEFVKKRTSNELQSFYILEPAWNIQPLEQQVGRVVRSTSHNYSDKNINSGGLKISEEISESN